MHLRAVNDETLAAQLWRVDVLPSRTSAIDARLIARIAASAHDRGRLGAP